LPTDGRRTLLLADDSPTVQKVVSLTFGDEGFRVITVGTGEQALAELERGVPDVVLADVHMPVPNGYELCARIKRDERTRGVPVMLLVGSFEPFDEAEARKSGADEVLTKPFQSIRELVNKVGGLLGGQPDAKKADARADEDETTHELRALPTDAARADETRRDAQPVASSNATPATNAAAPAVAFTDFGMDDQNIETVPAAEFDARDAAATTQASAPPAQSFAATAAARSYPQTFDARSAAAAAADDALLELGDLDTTQAGASADDDNEFVLDIGDGESYAPPRAQRDTPVYDAPVYSDAPVYTEDAPSAVEMQAAGSMSMSEPSAGWVAAEEFPVSPEAITEPVEAPAHVTEAMATTEATFSSFYDATRRDAKASAAEPEASEATNDTSLMNDSQVMTDSATTPELLASATSTQMGTAQLSPETIDAIARRVVEHLSDRVVREIAWEVVPDLAERLIRRKLEEEQARVK
jgi:CheY-like chemotaxis protein